MAASSDVLAETAGIPELLAGISSVVAEADLGTSLAVDQKLVVASLAVETSKVAAASELARGLAAGLLGRLSRLCG